VPKDWATRPTDLVQINETATAPTRQCDAHGSVLIEDPRSTTWKYAVTSVSSIGSVDARAKDVGRPQSCARQAASAVRAYLEALQSLHSDRTH
jgi:hypothetical protein